MKKTIIGVMGPGEAESYVLDLAYQLGQAIAANGWITLCGGRNAGVMEAVSKGAKENNGLTLGILPGDDLQHTSKFIDIPILTGMGSARNNINVLTSDVIVACGLGAGTASEIFLAIKARKPVILLGMREDDILFFKKNGGNLVYHADQIKTVEVMIKSLLDAGVKV